MTIDNNAEYELVLKATRDGIKEAQAEVDRLHRSLNEAQEAAGQFGGEGRKLDRELSNISDSFKKVTTSVDQSTKAVRKSGGSWDDYTARLKEAQKAHQQFAQDQVTGDSRDGSADVLSRSIAEQNEYFRTYEAGNASAISSIRGRLRAETDAIKTVENLRRKSVADSIRLSEREKDARIADMKAISAAYVASEQASRTAASNARYVPGASTSGLSAAQIESMSAAYGRTSTAVAKNTRTIRESTIAAQEAQRGTTVLTKAQSTASGGFTEATGSAISLRYALYDVSTTYGFVSAATLGASTATMKASANFESAFTNVQRTADGSISGLRDSLVDMSTEIPRSFEELSQVATLGNQLGIASRDVEGFTGTVARFSTVTGMTADASATAFGSLGELLNLSAADYEKLGSAIALVGRKSVATEPEIVALAQRLAASATNAGFSAQEVIALSGAFASLRVAPERAQGVMEVYFNRLNTALAEGGDKLDAFATYADLTTQELGNLAANDPNALFSRLAGNLGQLNSVAQTRALEQLGLDGIRAGEVFGRISGNMNVFTQALGDATTGYAQGTELANQYALVLDDLNTKLTILWNSFLALVAAGGDNLLPTFKSLVDVAIDVVNALRGFIDTPAGEAISRIALVVSTAIGVFTAYRGATALATASTYALRTAQVELAKMNASGGISGLIKSMYGLQAATNGATVRTLTLANAFRVLRSTTAWLAVIGFAIELLFNFGGVMNWVSDVAGNVGRGLQVIGGIIAEVGSVAGVSIGPIGAFGQALSTLGGMLANIGPGTDFGDWAKGLNTPDVPDFTDSVNDLNYAFESPASEDFGASLGNVGSAAGAAAKEVRTLKDYANDLSGVFDRAFEIRYSGGQALDQITSGWKDIAKAAADARQRMADYKATLADLAADEKIKQYWLSVAEQYGDELRATKLRAELAELNGKQAKTSKDLAGAQSEASTSLTGNSEAAIRNRASILGMVGSYQQYLTALAASGASQAELEAKSKQLKAEFVKQATQLGYNRAEVSKFADSFDDLTLAIQRVPRNITVKANANPAVQALAEYEAALNKARSNASRGIPSVSPSVNGRAVKAQALLGEIEALQMTLEQYKRTHTYTGGAWVLQQLKDKRAALSSLGYASGGYTGDGGVNDVAGYVHGKEFVFSAPAVKNIGVSNLGYMHEMAKRGKAVAPGASLGANGVLTVQLSAFDRRLLAQAGNVRVEIPGVAIAQATTNNNVSETSRRSG